MVIPPPLTTPVPPAGVVFLSQEALVSATQMLKLDDPEGGQLYVTRLDDVGYAIAINPSIDEDGNPQPFRLLDDGNRQQLKDFLRRIA